MHLKDERDVEKMAEYGCRDMEQLEEDVAMLRQILDNLLAFLYLKDVMNQFRKHKSGSPAFNKTLKFSKI
jgi:hypothetical protein